MDIPEPSFHANQNILGGQLSFVAFSDLNESIRNDIERIIKKNLGKLPSINDDAKDILVDIANEFDLLEKFNLIMKTKFSNPKRYMPDYHVSISHEHSFMREVQGQGYVDGQIYDELYAEYVKLKSGSI
ncbi:hypothetical protein [Gilliamella sp. GillExp13]|uniref:hypothetical protein n=1 Tax=Gilliamella sp. GillExp13 TaxID=3120243 RepID=UPI0011468A69|nr:hypothetical protein [Gilliamella apicola]